MSSPVARLYLPTPKSSHLNMEAARGVSPAKQVACLTFKEGGALLDVGPQLLKNAIDLLLGSDKVLEGGSIHLSHVSLVLLDCDNGVAPREKQGHRAAREDKVSNPRTPSLDVLLGPWQGTVGGLGLALGAIKSPGPPGLAQGWQDKSQCPQANKATTEDMWAVSL